MHYILVNLVSKIHITKIGIAKINIYIYAYVNMDDDDAVRQI